MGFHRNLTVGEIVDQVIQTRIIAGRRITNLVYMGMGEPLVNYENVMKSVEIISTGMGIAARRITISTAGIVPAIRRMGDENRKMKLAISLHSLEEQVRTRLMPITSKYSIAQLIDAVQYYYRKTRRRVTFEYILFDGWNDSDADLARLIKLSRTVPCKVNIIPFHSIAVAGTAGLASTLRPVSQERTEEFAARLRRAHLTVFVRSSAGEDIDGACGQLAVKLEHNPKRGNRTLNQTQRITQSP
jgi:23S rRNA (adenine2503-C2)-methyltransferase